MITRLDDVRRARARRRVTRRSPGVFFVKSTDGTYVHVVVLIATEARITCTIDQHDAKCWAARKVARYLLRNPQRILEAL